MVLRVPSESCPTWVMRVFSPIGFLVRSASRATAMLQRGKTGFVGAADARSAASGQGADGFSGLTPRLAVGR